MNTLEDLFDWPVFRFKHSAGIPNMFSSGDSLAKQVEKRSVLKNLYGGVMGDITAIAEWLGKTREDDAVDNLDQVN